MLKHWFVPLVVVMVVVIFAQPLLANVEGTPSAEAFCNGSEGWQMDLNNNPDPADPSCGKSVFKVEVNGEMSSELNSFADALQNLKDRDGIGTVWFIPAKPTPTPAPVQVPAPEGFCNGGVPWPVNLNTEIPQDPQCPTGIFKVDVSGDFGDVVFTNLQDALNNLIERGSEGTLWFEPTPPTPTPTPEPVAVPAPEGFCNGGVPWPVNLNTEIPQDPQCPTGIFKVDVSGDFGDVVFTNLQDALNNLIERGSEGTLWFEPTPPTPTPTPEPVAVPAPEGFCNGGVPWQINLNTEIPQDPQCPTGIYKVEVNGNFGDVVFTNFQDALTNLTERATEGTLWFEPTPIATPTPEPVAVSAPAGFCNGGVNWGVNLNTQIPQDPNCGPGIYKVTISDVLQNQTFQTFSDAINFIATTKNKEGGLWFEHTPQVLSRTYIPTVLNKLLENPPGQFCDGIVGWLLNLLEVTPSFPDCDNGSFVVNIGDQEPRTFPTFRAARRYISGHTENQGSIWFVPGPPEPVPVPAPDKFCKGTEGWRINLQVDIPIDPDCGSGKYLTDVGTSKENLLNFSAAIEYIRNHEGVGTVWYVD